MGPKAAEFREITQNNGHYAVQGHSRSPISVPIESSCDFLLVINTNLHPIVHRFQVMAPFLSLLQGDCGRRGWYDCPIGAEAFVQCSPMRLLPQMYAN